MKCSIVDSNVTTFSVSVHSMSNVDIQTIKDLIEKRLKVVDIKLVDKKVNYVKD